MKWQELYTKYKGKIDEQFGFLAFQTAPLVTSTSMDAKIATADLASRMMLWAVFGKPNQREWAPSPMQKEEYAKNDGLYPGGYRLIAAEPSDSLRASIGANEKARLESKSAEQSRPERGNRGKGDGQYADKLWKGWLLPTSDADTWFTAGSAVYYQDLRSGDVERAMAAHWAMYRELMLAEEPNESQRYQIALYKGAIFLDSLRRGMGDDRFFEVMGTFYAANTTKPVSAQAFLDAAGATFTLPKDPGGPLYLVREINGRLSSAMIVYGTSTDAGANRYAAEQLQKHYLDMFESAVPLRKDFELTPEELRAHDVIFIGRPETNSALAGIAKEIGLDYTAADFRMDGKEHASETEALSLAAANPRDRKHMVLVLAGNSPLETVRLVQSGGGRRQSRSGAGSSEYSILDSGNEIASGFRTASSTDAKAAGSFAKR